MPSLAVPLTLKNVYGIVGIAAIALLWTVIVGVLGGIVVVVLVVALVVILRARMRRRKPVEGPADEAQK
jgi:heme/copper-type cytochrome/quinol oxidase subunit 2